MFDGRCCARPTVATYCILSTATASVSAVFCDLFPTVFPPSDNALTALWWNTDEVAGV